MNFSVAKFFPKVPLKLFVLCFLITFSAFQYAYSTTYVNTAQEAYFHYINQSIYNRYHEVISQEAMAWIWTAIVNSVQIGIIIGTLLIPYPAEKYGRRWCLLATIIPESSGVLLSAIAIPLQMPELLCFGRFCLAMAVGMNFNATTLFVQEISPTKVRGFLSSLVELMVSISAIAGVVLGLPSVLGCESCLIYLASVGFISPALRTVLFCCPETPKYLFVEQHNTEKACQSIRFYHGSKINFTSVLEELKREASIDDDTSGSGSNKNILSCLKTIWRDRRIRKAVIIGTVVFTAARASGITPIYEFSTYILVDTGLDYNLAQLGTVLMALLNTVFTVVSMISVDRFGRRKLLLFGITGLIICLGTFMIFATVHQQLDVSWTGYGTMVSLILHSIIFTGPGPICWFITSELVPQQLRSSAQAVTQVFNQILDFIISSVFFPAYTTIGVYSFLILFIIPLIFCLIYLYLELPETKNREISDIVLNMTSKKMTGTFIERF